MPSTTTGSNNSARSRLPTAAPGAAPRCGRSHPKRSGHGRRNMPITSPGSMPSTCPPSTRRSAPMRWCCGPCSKPKSVMRGLPNGKCPSTATAISGPISHRVQVLPQSRNMRITSAGCATSRAISPNTPPMPAPDWRADSRYRGSRSRDATSRSHPMSWTIPSKARSGPPSPLCRAASRRPIKRACAPPAAPRSKKA